LKKCNFYKGKWMAFHLFELSCVQVMCLLLLMCVTLFMASLLSLVVPGKIHMLKYKNINIIWVFI
jgi:hypothetical protein